jgi:soluble lytic murein transglycosylase
MVPPPTRILMALALACVVGFALQAGSAGSAPAEKEKQKASTAAAKDKAVAPKAASKDAKASTKDAAAKSKDAAKTKDKAKAAGATKDATKDKSATVNAAPPPTGSLPRTNSTPAPVVAAPISAADLSAVKEAIAQARRSEPQRASEIQKTISDPAARKLVEWAILRSDDNEVDYRRYTAFINENPNWPSIGFLRRRAETALWQDRLDPATVRAHFGRERPVTSKGKFALARALLLLGDRAGAQSLVREAWRYENFPGDLENQVLDVFRDLITTADHKARMDMRLYAEDAD